MGTDNLFHKRNREIDRKIALRSAKKHILIVCEGRKTEPNYFKSFCVTSAEVKIVGKGANTISLVRYAKEQRDKAFSEKPPYDQIWCVFDKDSFKKEQFDAAIQMAKLNKFKVVYSNEAFELWYLLHFDYLTAAISRDQYKKKLTKYLRRKYKKNDADMYSVLIDKQKTAIMHAKNLLKWHNHKNPADSNPSTTVYLLVEELNKLK